MSDFYVISKGEFQLVAMAGEPNPNVSNESYENAVQRTNHIRPFRADRKKRVLVVDDNDMIRAFLYDALSVLDCEVATASSGAFEPRTLNPQPSPLNPQPGSRFPHGHSMSSLSVVG